MRRKANVDYSPQAREDLIWIAAYTEARWGNPHSAKYLRDLRNTIESLGSHPNLGKVRTELAPGLRSLAIAQHVVFYRLQDTTALILRVLHGRETPPEQLAEPDSQKEEGESK